MSKKHVLTFLSVFLLMTASLACSVLSSTPIVTQSPVSSPTTAPFVNPTLTKEFTLPATSVPTPSIKQEWTIKIGEIQYIGVAADGTVYGVSPNLYAVISKDGEVSQTNEVNLRECLRSNFTGGSGDTEIDRWFVIKPNGTLLTTSFIVPCTISPGNPPTIEKTESGDFFPYADDSTTRKTPSTPSGFANNWANPYLYFSRLDGFDFFVNANEKIGAFVDHNGEIQYFDFPQDMNLEVPTGDKKIAITPWDDIYISYASYDTLGNNLGRKNIKINENGTEEIVDTFPQLGQKMTDTNSISNLSYVHPLYLPERKEVYFYEGSSLRVYDLDFNFLREYLLPSNFPEISYGTINYKHLFVGHDGNAYVLDTSIPNSRTLTKYSLSPNATQP